MKKILFTVLHRPNRSPSQRFRFEQYLPFLKEVGFDCEFSYLLSESDDKRWYSSGHYLVKIWIVLKSIIRRWRDVWRANQYDIIFIQREAFMLGTPFFEKRFKRSTAKIIFDLDDAIWLQDISELNNKFLWLKNSRKTDELLRLADLVIAGNEYLADY